MLKLFLDPSTVERALEGKGEAGKLLEFSKEDVEYFAESSVLERARGNGFDEKMIERIRPVKEPGKRELARFRTFLKGKDEQVAVSTYMTTDCAYFITNDKDIMRKVGNAITPADAIAIAKEKGAKLEKTQAGTINIARLPVRTKGDSTKGKKQRAHVRASK